MTIRFAATVIALATAAGLTEAPAMAANLITNGSFEDTAGFAPPADDTMSLGSGATTMTGWTVVSDFLSWIGPTNPFSLSASDGDYFLDLTDYQGGAPFGGVQQSVTTISGNNYRLSFDLGSSVIHGYGSIDVSAGGLATTFTSSIPFAANAWETKTFDFLATSGSTTLSLIGSSGSHYIGLDNLVLTDLGPANPVPEPATWALLVAGFGMTGAVMRRQAGRAMAR
jgi:hypothetical protein